MLAALRKPHRPGEFFVVELSSYQLDDIEFSPHIAVVLNLFPEHMPYHGGVKKYYEAKKNIIKFQRDTDFFVYNPRDRKLAGWAKTTRSKARPFAAQIPLGPDEIPLLGEHNAQNVRAAVAVARVLGLTDKAIRRAIRVFKPLPHRLQRVGAFRGITFYDDAISTAPESTIAALAALPKTKTILLGGEDRGYDFTRLEKILRRCGVENIVLFPDSGKRILKSRNGFKILETSSMEKAVAFAYTHTPRGSTCLLSTASPSYTLWKNFEEKGSEFQFFVRKHANNRSRAAR